MSLTLAISSGLSVKRSLDRTLTSSDSSRIAVYTLLLVTVFNVAGPVYNKNARNSVAFHVFIYLVFLGVRENSETDG